MQTFAITCWRPTVCQKLDSCPIWNRIRRPCSSASECSVPCDPFQICRIIGPEECQGSGGLIELTEKKRLHSIKSASQRPPPTPLYLPSEPLFTASVNQNSKGQGRVSTRASCWLTPSWLSQTQVFNRARISVVTLTTAQDQKVLILWEDGFTLGNAHSSAQVAYAHCPRALP